MDGKHLLSNVAFHYQRYLGFGTRMKGKGRGYYSRIEMTKMVLGSICFPNEVHMKGQVILGPQGKIYVFIKRDFLSVLQLFHFKMGIMYLSYLYLSVVLIAQ